MKKIAFLISLFITVLSHAQLPALQWAKNIGSTSGDAANSVATDAAGNVFTTGSFQGTVDFDPGPGVFNLNSVGSNDAFISKLDGLGNFLWAIRVCGASSSDNGADITVDAFGNVYTTGNFSGSGDFDPGPATLILNSANAFPDIFITKHDPSGNLLWAKKIGGTLRDYGYKIKTDLAGDVFISGNFTTLVDFDPGPATFTLSATYPDGFILKLNTTGNFIWAKQIGGPQDDSVSDFDFDSSGNIYAVGSFSSSIDLDPGPATYSVNATGDVDGYIVKLDASGNFIWAGKTSGFTADAIGEIAIDASDNIYITGSFTGVADLDPGPAFQNFNSNGSYDFFISRLDATGNSVWIKQFGTSTSDACFSATLDQSGNIFTTGFFEGTVDFDPSAAIYTLTAVGNRDVFILGLDAAGNFVLASNFGGSQADWGYGINTDIYNNIYVAGYFNATADFDPGPATSNLTSNGNSDIFVCKFGSSAPVSIKEGAGKININLYPNPFNDQLTIQSDQTVFSELNASTKIEIYNSLGQLVLKEQITSQNVKMDLKNLCSGIFVLKITNHNKNIYTKKIIKE
jgi:Secretion system C-terminal sorting domain/Beta-propeller repeat